MYGRILSFSFKGSATRCRSSSSPTRATTPYLSSAALQQHGAPMLRALENIMRALFDDWDFTVAETRFFLQAFMNQREYLEPEVRRAVWQLGGALESPDQPTPSDHGPRGAAASHLDLPRGDPAPAEPRGFHDFFHHAFRTVHTVHSVCSPFTLVVNAHQSLLSSAQSLLSHNIYISSLPRAVAGTIYLLTWIHYHFCLILSIKPLQHEVHACTTIAPPEQVASQRTTSAPSELVAPERIMSASVGKSSTDDSPLSSASQRSSDSHDGTT